VSRLLEGYRYLANQDAPLWKTVAYCFKANLWEPFNFLLFQGRHKPEYHMVINPYILCHHIALATGEGEGHVWALHQEFLNDSEFHESITAKLMTTSERHDKHPDFGYRALLYLMVRIAKPSVMIETGSYDGLSTAAILLAMHKNAKGRLYTIDLPNPSLPRDIGARPAWVVPDYLRGRLMVIEGKSSEWLEWVIKIASPVDMFYHDSWHTYENMMFEYKTMWKAVRPGGWFISEYKPRLNKAFRDFTRDKPMPMILARRTHFIVQKPILSLPTA
jgi:predicted O-methyltransferase YrrM